MKFLALSVTILILFAVFFISPVYAAPGTLDLSFGTNGVVTTNFTNTSNDEITSLGIQADGKIVAGGLTFDGVDYDIALARYNNNGSLDSSFGAGGLVITDISGLRSEVLNLEIQTDGKIVVSGDAYNGVDLDFVLLRYNSDGTLDTGFGTGGKVITDFSGNDAVYGLVLQGDGKIVAAGSGNFGQDFVLARYNSDGTLDTGFGTGGKVITDLGSTSEGIFGLVLQADGKLVAAGTGGSSGFAIARYNTDGTLDTGFGTGGKVITQSNILSTAYSMVLQTDGKFILGGSANVTTGDFALVRYNQDGTLDSSFGTGGITTTDFNSSEEVILALGLQTDGKILATGLSAGIFTSNDFALVRYNTNGTLDTNFGTGGKVSLDLNGSDEYAVALAIQSDGQAVLGGLISLGSGANSAFGLTRFNTSALENIAGAVTAGGTITSDSESDGATSVDPIETTITSPVSGNVTISEITPSLQPPSGYSFLGSQVNITAPTATADNPLRFVFVLDSSVVNGADVNTIQVLRNNVLVPPCLGSPGVASPDPCVSSRLLLAGGDAQITALTSQASSWNLALQTNTAPEITSLSPSEGQLYALGSPVNLNASFTDGLGDSHTCSISWDDGQTTQGTVSETNGSGDCTQTHDFASAGVYTINAVITDNGGLSTSRSVMVVVFDPVAGFVTGGGWINSPAGAYTADPSVSGVANFGFVSRYQKGAAVPTGQTQFQFKMADFNFHSDSYQWLVVAGSKAQYKGSGSVNGVSGYNFILTATDGDSKDNPDKFRIKITKDGNVVYDNALGFSDDIDSANPQVLGGGSVIIHK